MEEDIKLLENFCEVFRMTQRCIDKYEREEYGETIGQDEIQAIENLIARNKELEEMIKILQHYLEMEEFDNAGDFLVAIDKILDLYQKEKEKNKELRKPKYIMDFKTNKITKLENDFISKDEIRKFETDIYRSYDYDMGVSESFIKFLEEKGILERN